jgi:hypothetical protein
MKKEYFQLGTENEREPKIGRPKIATFSNFTRETIIQIKIIGCTRPDKTCGELICSRT